MPERIHVPTTEVAGATRAADVATGHAAHVNVAGPPEVPAVVFVHGTRLTRSVWVAQQTALSGEFRTIALDLPGHGTRADEPFSLDGAADVLSATIRDQASGGRAVVVGLSLGGYVAMALAAREPERIRGLVVSGATAEPVGLVSLSYLTVAAVVDRVEDDRLGRLNAAFLRRRYPPALAEPIIAGGFWWRGGTAALRALAGQRFIPRLAAYPGRTLILNGDRDVLFRLSAPAFSAAAQDARRIRLARATHLANLDRPVAFSEAVRRFARSLGAA